MEQATNQIEQAYQAWKKLQNRETNPDGKFDSGGRWYPSKSEEQACCAGIRSPSRAHPYSHLVHCRSVEHVARKFGVDVKALRSHIAKQRPQANREGGVYYKLVALDEGQYKSIFDGQTVYQIGEELYERAHRNHGGGFYVHRSARAALSARFPASSQLTGCPAILLTVECSGNYCVYDEKLSFSRLTPTTAEAVLCRNCDAPITVDSIHPLAFEDGGTVAEVHCPTCKHLYTL